MTRYPESLILLVLVLFLAPLPGRAERPGQELPGRAELLALRLELALDRGALVELEELGRRALVGDLRTALGAPERKVVLGAIAAARAADDAWVLLTPLAALAHAPDRPIAAAAAAVAVDIAAALDIDSVLTGGVPVEQLATRLHVWRAVAAAEDRWADIRVHALEVTSLLAALAGEPAPGYSLARTVLDPDPEVRRAGFELLPSPLPEGATMIAARAVVGEEDPVVALAAAQSLCSEPAPGAPILDALGEAGIERIRALVQAPLTAGRALPPAALLDSARCLAADARSLAADARP